MHPVRGDVVERLQDKPPFLHKRVGQGEPLRPHHDVIVCNQVDVDGAVVVDAVFALAGAAQQTLNLLGRIQNLYRGKRCQYFGSRKRPFFLISVVLSNY